MSNLRKRLAMNKKAELYNANMYNGEYYECFKNPEYKEINEIKKIF